MVLTLEPLDMINNRRVTVNKYSATNLLIEIQSGIRTCAIGSAIGITGGVKTVSALLSIIVSALRLLASSVLALIQVLYIDTCCDILILSISWGIS